MLVWLFVGSLFDSHDNRDAKHWNLLAQFCTFHILLCEKDGFQPSFMEGWFISPVVRLEVFNDMGLELEEFG